FIQIRAWHIKKHGDKVVENKNEISRSTFTTCGQLDEMKDLCRSNHKENPMPGVCVLQVQQDLFSLMKPACTLFADTSRKRAQIFTRVWNVIKSGNTYYKDQ